MMKIIEYKIGNMVEIVNTGNHYPSYDTMAVKLNATKWIPEADVRNGLCGIIVNKHTGTEKFDKNIYLVDVGNIEILISADGLKLQQEWDEEEN